MERIDPRSRRDRWGSRINRDHSPVLVYTVPWVSVMIASLTPFLPVIPPAPVLPPLAFMMLMAWCFLRPGLLPPWAGLPLGLWDDLFSGQPLGSGILLFSLALLIIDAIDLRLPWRTFWLDWLIAASLSAAYLVVAAMVSGARVTPEQLTVILPQVLLTIAPFPLVALLVALLDRLRLWRIRRIG